VQRDSMERCSEEWAKNAEERFKAPLVAKYEKEGHPLSLSAWLWDDCVIRPSDTSYAGVGSVCLAKYPD
ncbi:hypothetical protein IWW50_000266, partial [Coemansia erecta]